MVQSQQKSYGDNRKRDLEFMVGDVTTHMYNLKECGNPWEGIFAYLTLCSPCTSLLGIIHYIRHEKLCGIKIFHDINNTMEISFVKYLIVVS